MKNQIETLVIYKKDGSILKEIELEEPIRYGVNDPIEKWLNDLLCLDAT